MKFVSKLLEKINISNIFTNIVISSLITMLLFVFSNFINSEFYIQYYLITILILFNTIFLFGYDILKFNLIKYIFFNVIFTLILLIVALSIWSFFFFVLFMKIEIDDLFISNYIFVYWVVSFLTLLKSKVKVNKVKTVFRNNIFITIIILTPLFIFLFTSFIKCNSTTIKIENRIMIEDGNFQDILKKLKCSSEWYVTEIKRGLLSYQLVAILRNKYNEFDYNTLGVGYINPRPFVDYTGKAQVVLKSPDFDAVKRINGKKYNVSYENLDDKEIRIDVYCGSISHLNLKNDNYCIEIYEESDNLDRIFTKVILKKIKKEIVNNEFYYPEQLDFSKGVFNFYERNKYGIFSFEKAWKNNYSFSTCGVYENGIIKYFNGKAIRGYINMGKPGKVYLKICDINTTKNILRKPLDRNILPVEYVGWSNNMDDKFFFEIPFAYVDGSTDEEYTEKFELWFHPLDNSGDLILYEKQYINNYVSKQTRLNCNYNSN